MTDKLYCPFCGAELHTRKLLTGMIDYVCINNQCDFSYTPLSLKWWQAMIDGKKAQEDSKCVKEELECVKHNYSVLSEQKEIAYQNYLKITGDLQTQLQKTQDALNEIDNMLFKLILKAHDLTALDLLKGITDIRLKTITSITKQEE